MLERVEDDGDLFAGDARRHGARAHHAEHGYPRVESGRHAVEKESSRTHDTVLMPTRPTLARGGRLPRSARRKQLLAAAQEVFVANGYHAAAMDDIAERAGVSKPVLYQHFPGKLELYLALLDTQAERSTGAVKDALAATDDNQERIHGVLSAYFDFVDRHDAATARSG